MSVEGARAFIEKLQESADFRTEVIKHLKDGGLEGCQRHCRDLGFEFTGDDLEEIREDLGLGRRQPEIAELIDMISCISVITPNPYTPPGPT